jgi:hypothetical protein
METREQADPGSGFSVLDGVALVMGAAVASVHIRDVIRGGLTTFAWALIWGTFAWVAVTAAGPFVFLVRRFARRLPDYPKVGDVLWVILGIPWLLTAVLKSADPAGDPPRNEFVLSLGLPIAAMIALAIVWKQWVMVPPEQASRAASPPWTNRLGLILSIAWPIQCGVGLLVLG